MPTAAVVPASTGKIAPVIHLAWSLAKKVTAQAASHPFPSVPSKLRFFLASRASSLIPPAYIIGVYNIYMVMLASDYGIMRVGLHQDKRNSL